MVFLWMFFLFIVLCLFLTLYAHQIFLWNTLNSLKKLTHCTTKSNITSTREQKWQKCYKIRKIEEKKDTKLCGSIVYDFRVFVCVFHFMNERPPWQSVKEREINWQLFCIEEEKKQAEFKKKESFSWCWMRADMQPIVNTHTHTNMHVPSCISQPEFSCRICGTLSWTVAH